MPIKSTSPFTGVRGGRWSGRPIAADDDDVDRSPNQHCAVLLKVRACACVYVWGVFDNVCVCVIRSVSFASPNHCRTCDARVRVHASNTCWVRCTNTTDDDIETGVCEHARASVFESVCMRVCAGDPVLLCECTRAHIRVWKKCSFTYYYNRTTPRTAMLI